MTFQVSIEDGLYYRQTLFDNAKRVVVKAGSAVLTSDKGLKTEAINNIARELSFLRKTGREVILVSSGAVAAGRKHLGDKVKLSGELKVKQALAAMGQGMLMQAYEQAFGTYGQKVAQVLLTHSDLSSRDRYLNVRNTILTLFDFGVIPVINENDTVSVEELRFGDNDTLGALMANMIGADMFIILTDVDGLFTASPQDDPAAMPVYTVAHIDSEVERMAGFTKSALGTGGMQSKIRAAKMVAASGGSSFIGPGNRPDILQDLFSGEMVGTFFLPRAEKIKSRKHWIAYVLKPQGYIVLDDGACKAVVERGKSLLPSGIMEVSGQFGVGAPVQCRTTGNRVIAAGLTNYNSGDIKKIKGRRSSEIEGILGFCDSDEIIHRDNLVLLDTESLQGSLES
ncbi:MAG: glutamate 5-kinase [Desulfobulbaceae bacterium]|nr:glutamate 5-kinase [Desulfobulbaceae bacterium]